MLRVTAARPLTADQARRRFIVLRGLRWLATGFVIPVLVILMQQRGLTLAEIGLVTAAQAAAVLLLELPTGGLADALGRRPVLLAATVFEVASLAVLVVAREPALFVVAFLLQGVYRALESGPLDAWYVDAALAAAPPGGDPHAAADRGLAAGGVATGVALATGAIAAAGLTALPPVAGIDPLVLPLLAAAAVRAVEFVAVLSLVREDRPRFGPAAVAASVRAVPGVIGDTLRLVRGSTALAALVAVELFWGAGMTAFETLMPARLVELIGDAETGVAVFGPAAAVAWIAAAGGAAAVPRLVTLLGGAARAAALLRVAQGVGVLGMALAGGPGLLVAAYLAVFVVHGAANPVHQGLLHRAVDAGHRSTVLSLNSLLALAGGGIGGIVLGAVATGVTIPVAMVVGAVLLAAPAPLYLLAARPIRMARAGAGAKPHAER